MQAILTQKKCIEALKVKAQMHARLTEEEKTEMVDKVRSYIILCLVNTIQSEVSKEKTMASIWKQIESLYMTMSLSYRLCLKTTTLFILSGREQIHSGVVHQILQDYS